LISSHPCIVPFNSTLPQRLESQKNLILASLRKAAIALILLLNNAAGDIISLEKMSVMFSPHTVKINVINMYKGK
jgi:hypothetical protein